MSSRVCSSCGQPQGTADHFCSFCGAAQPEHETLEIALDAPAAVAPAVPWRALEGLGMWLVATLATFGVAAPLAGQSTNQTSAAIIIANEFLLAVVVVLWIRIRHKVSAAALGLKGRVSDIPLGIGLGLLGYFVAAIVGGMIIEAIRSITGGEVEQPEQIQIDGTPSTGLLIAIGIGVVLLAPIAEEMLFRGVVFRGLRNWARPGPAIVLSAFFFGIAHLYPLIIPPIFVLGLILAWVVERRGSILPSIAAHVTFNVIGFSFLIADKT